MWDSSLIQPGVHISELDINRIPSVKQCIIAITGLSFENTAFQINRTLNQMLRFYPKSLRKYVCSAFCEDLK